MAWDYDAAAHLMARAGFGDPPPKIDRLVKIGRDRAVDSMVDYQDIDNTKFEKQMRRGFPFIKSLRSFSEAFVPPSYLENWWFTRILFTPRPLEERMTLFWHSHFATEISVVRSLAIQQNITLRENAVAQFDTLVLNLAKDPAMLRYLNNDENYRDHPNQNFARELMELHTMGITDVVMGQENYSQADVEAVARAFTGWTFERTGPPIFRLDETQHDFGGKSVFGRPPANLNGDDVVFLICQRPATARFISKKLFEFFAYRLTGSDEDRATIEAFARVYMNTQHSIKELVRSILKSDQFLSERARFSQRKSPIELVVGAIRRLGAEYPIQTAFLSVPADFAGRMGQRLFSPPNVAGWKTEFWFNASSFLERFNFATHLATSRPGFSTGFEVDVSLTLEQVASYADKSPEKTVDNLLRVLGPLHVDAATRAALINYLTTEDGVPVTFKPNSETIDRKVRNLVALIMMLPEASLN
jgi:uncharacterized protein (DUF1800 family)